MAITDVIKIKEMVKAKDKGERLEEELQMTEKISPQEGYFSGSPHGDKFWNEPRKRTPEDQNRSQEGIIEYMRDNMQQEMMMNYLMEMFNQSPSDFEQQFGNEAAETMRMLQGFKTKGQMEEDGMIFEPGTTELRAHKASFSPDQVALGTLPTDQSEDTGKLSEFFQNYKEQLERWRILSKEEARSVGLPVDRGQIYQRNTVTGVTKQMKTTVEDQFRVLSQEESNSFGLPEGEIYQLNEATGKVEILDMDREDKFSIISKEHARSMGLPIDSGQIYQRNEVTGNIQLLDRSFKEGEKIQESLKEEIGPKGYLENVTEMNEDISGILKNLPKEMWYNLLDKIKPYYLDELDMRLLHEGVDFDGVLKEERLIERGSEDWNKLQKLKQDLQNQIDERWTRE